MPNEYELLDSELRKLRMNKHNLENDVNKLFNEKIAIQKEIGNLNAMRGKALEGKKEADNILLEVKKEAAKYREEMSTEQAKLLAKEKALDKRSEELDERYAALLEMAETQKNREINLKEDKRVLVIAQAKIDQTEARLKDEEKGIVAEWAKIRQANEDAAKNAASAEKVKAETCENLAKSKDLMAKVLEKNEAVDKQIILLNAQKDSFKKIEAQVEAENKEISLARQKNAEDAMKIELKEKGLNRSIEALKTRENEIEIKRLRVEKIIKEKGIAEELHKLEEELKS